MGAKEIVVVVVYRMNVARPICNHLVGKEHTFAHRLITGVLIMAVGIFIAQYYGHHHNELIAAIGDGVGYALHGLGLTPIVEAVVKNYGE